MGLMNMQHLHSFWTVVLTKNYKEAAARLNLSISAISRHITALEDSLQLRLLKRTSKGLELTEAGRLVYRFAEQMMLLTGRLMEDLEQLQKKPLKLLPLACSETVANYVLPQMIVDFKEIFPEITLRPWIASSQMVEEKVAKKEYPLGLIAGCGNRNKLRYRPFSHDELLLVGAPDHPVCRAYYEHGDGALPVQLLQESILFIRSGHSLYRETVEQQLVQHHLHISSFFELNNTESIKQAVIRGRGLAFLSRFSIQTELKTGILVPIPEPSLKITRFLHIVTVEDDEELDEGYRSFIRFLLRSPMHRVEPVGSPMESTGP